MVVSCDSASNVTVSSQHSANAFLPITVTVAGTLIVVIPEPENA
jgi:hypothetical protein